MLVLHFVVRAPSSLAVLLVLLYQEVLLAKLEGRPEPLTPSYDLAFIPSTAAFPSPYSQHVSNTYVSVVSLTKAVYDFVSRRTSTKS
jgi:hypothetical protein